MATEESKISSELNELQLSYQQSILSQNAIIHKFANEDTMIFDKVTIENRQFIPYIRIDIFKKTIDNLNDEASEKLVNDIFNYLDAWVQNTLS